MCMSKLIVSTHYSKKQQKSYMYIQHITQSCPNATEMQTLAAKSKRKGNNLHPVPMCFSVMESVCVHGVNVCALVTWERAVVLAA